MMKSLGFLSLTLCLSLLPSVSHAAPTPLHNLTVVGAVGGETRQFDQNRLTFVVHIDEKTPHMHLCFVPLTTDHRLSAKGHSGQQKN